VNLDRTTARNITLGAAIMLGLAACSNETSVEDPSDPDQIAAAMDNLPSPQPGQYQLTGELVELEIPGAGEEEMALISGLLKGGFEQAQSFCVTEEMAAEGFQQWVKQIQTIPEDCEYTSYETTGSTLKGVMACSSDDGTSGTIELSGTMTETEQNFSYSMDMKNPNEEVGEMRMAATMKTSRTGDCE